MAPHRTTAVAIQTKGMNAIRDAELFEYKNLRTTSSGRKVALTFGKEGGSRGTTIYMDDIVTVVERRERRRYSVANRSLQSVSKKSVVKKAVAKKAVAKKAVRSDVPARKLSRRVMTIDGVIRGQKFDAIPSSALIERLYENSATLISEKAVIPGSIRKFALYFFDNIRKLICPKRGVKPTLSAPTTASVSTLAIWITGHFGLAAAVAGGLASAVLLLIVTATKGAFCDLAADLAKELIRKA